MASSYYMPEYIHSQSGFDARPSWMDDDVSSILDDNILENTLDSALELSPVEQRRRESMMDAAIYSPSRDWTDFDHDMGASASLDGGLSPLPAASFEHSTGTNNPFIKLETAQQSYSPAASTWNARVAASGTATPAVYDGAFTSSHFESSYLSNGYPAAANFEASSTGHITPHSVYQAPVVSSSVPSASADNQWSAGVPTSAPVPNGNDQTESRPLTKRMRPQSPGPRSNSPLTSIRRDGIRKKNARFDIPAERTLLNIDHLIAQSADEQEIKELKQQKRLLRNRQAALDSRQRKKQHTERLEEEKKMHSTLIADLEEKLQLLTCREQEWKARLDEVTQQRDYARHQGEVLQMEKEEMVKKHTIESGDLRKKNNYLENQVQKLETIIEQNNISNGAAGAYADEFAFEDMDIGGFWGPSTFTADPFDLPAPDLSNALVKKSEKVGKAEKVDATQDKPVASGILLILLLCGALVASSSSKAASLPPLPQPIRTASADLLQNIFQEAGVSQTSQGRVEDASDVVMGESWLTSKSDVPRMVGLESSVAVLNAQLQESSIDQGRDSLMQLTADEYNEVTSKEFLREPEPTTQRGRKHLEAGLASMRSKASAAEVYTRSLLWDRVDAEVVRRFAAFAEKAQRAAHNAAEGDAPFQGDTLL